VAVPKSPRKIRIKIPYKFAFPDLGFAVPNTVLFRTRPLDIFSHTRVQSRPAANECARRIGADQNDRDMRQKLMDGLAIDADDDGQPIRSAQAIEASKDFSCWTTWTAFAPSILRLRDSAPRIETRFWRCSVCPVRYY
jgi:hypothetical protein